LGNEKAKAGSQQQESRKRDNGEVITPSVPEREEKAGMRRFDLDKKQYRV